MIGSTIEGLRVLVVDDEAPARQRLTEILRQDSSVKTILEAADGRVAVHLIQKEKPDLVFLDVQMPELTGLEVLESIGAAHMPLTIFVTAFDQHAIRAFESNALDYLLKPFSDERLEAAMARARNRLDELHMREFGRNILGIIKTAPSDSPLDRLVVKSNGITQFIKTIDIDWLESAGVYVTLHCTGKEILYRSSLSELAEKLDPLRFIRIHRSVIVNIDSILHLEPLSHGEFDVVLKSGTRSRVSRTYRALLEKRLGQSL